MIIQQKIPSMQKSPFKGPKSLGLKVTNLQITQPNPVVISDKETIDTKSTKRGPLIHDATTTDRLSVDANETILDAFVSKKETLDEQPHEPIQQPTNTSLNDANVSKKVEHNKVDCIITNTSKTTPTNTIVQDSLDDIYNIIHKSETPDNSTSPMDDINITTKELSPPDKKASPQESIDEKEPLPFLYSSTHSAKHPIKTKPEHNTVPQNTSMLIKKPSINKQKQKSSNKKSKSQYTNVKSPTSQPTPHTSTHISKKSLKIVLPISIQSLAYLMKIKISILLHFIQSCINDDLSQDTIITDKNLIDLIQEHFKQNIECQERQSVLSTFFTNDKDDIGITTSPIVSFMGHVDHGKTSLIDWCRKSSLVNQEAGNITQKVRAFAVPTDSFPITILDTPGHEAFMSIRDRSAKLSDIIVIVVDGKEGIKQQTIEALQLLKTKETTEALVAITKKDLPDFNEDLVLRQLAEQNYLPEVWGGTTITVSCSSATGENMPLLIENIKLIAEMMELKAYHKSKCFGIIIESYVDAKVGIKVLCIIKQGSLRTKHWACTESSIFKIRAIKSDTNNVLPVVVPNIPVVIHGFTSHPKAGELFFASENRHIIEQVHDTLANNIVPKANEPALSVHKIFEEKKPTINLIIKADAQGSLDAINRLITGIDNSKASVEILKADLGGIQQSDIDLAMLSNAYILNFNVSLSNQVAAFAKANNVTILSHNIIYNILDNVLELMQTQLAPITKEQIHGELKILITFKSSKVGCIAGCVVQHGIINRKHKIRLVRKQSIIWEGPMSSMQTNNRDVNSVKTGEECGIVLQKFSDVQVDDIMIAFSHQQEQQTL